MLKRTHCLQGATVEAEILALVLCLIGLLGCVRLGSWVKIWQFGFTDFESKNTKSDNGFGSNQCREIKSVTNFFFGLCVPVESQSKVNIKAK